MSVSHTTFELVKEAIVRVAKIDPERITLESHVTDDLDIESLDFVDILMFVEDKLGIEIPLPKQEDKSEFTIGEVCKRIDQLRADKK
jgi:acyl carrier protein